MHTNCIASAVTQQRLALITWGRNWRHTEKQKQLQKQKQLHSLETELALSQSNLKAQLLTLTCSKPHSVNSTRLKILKKQIFKVLEVVALPSSFLPPTSDQTKAFSVTYSFWFITCLPLPLPLPGKPAHTKNSLLLHIHSRCLEYLCDYDKALALRCLYQWGRQTTKQTYLHGRPW